MNIFKISVSFITKLLISGFIFSSVLLQAQSSFAKVVVACVGDSITAGFTLQNPGEQSYPSHLQKLLGSNYQVLNFGHTGATLLNKGNIPYTQTSEYAGSIKSNPNIVVIMLGTNDSKPFMWSTLAKEYPKDYAQLIKTYQSLPTHPKVFICLILPYCKVNPWTNDFPDPSRIPHLLLPAINLVHKQTGVKLIDNYKKLVNHPELFTDGIHPTEVGATMIAKNVYKAITAKSTVKQKK